MRTIHFIITAAAAAVMLPGCVKDTIYNTDHPGQAKVVSLTADWVNRGGGVDKPASYTITTNGMNETATSDRTELNRIFEPGSYTFAIYNTPASISVSGTTATADYSGGGPGWFLAGIAAADLQSDTEYNLTVAAAQEVRRLTLIVEPEGNAGDNIAGIEASLSGVAGTLDFSDGTHSVPTDAAIVFTKAAAGEHAGKWTAEVLLLGMAAAEHKLTGTISFIGGSPDDTALESDLTAELSNFNTDKKTPLSLSARLVIVPDPEVEAGFTATIEDWKTGGGGSGIAT